MPVRLDNPEDTSRWVLGWHDRANRRSLPVVVDSHRYRLTADPAGRHTELFSDVDNARAAIGELNEKHAADEARIMTGIVEHKATCFGTGPNGTDCWCVSYGYMGERL